MKRLRTYFNNMNSRTYGLDKLDAFDIDDDLEYQKKIQKALRELKFRLDLGIKAQ